MKKTGLYFGSFNPVHIGHLIVAEHMVSHHVVDELWMVVSPQNPLKQSTTLAPEEDRLMMAQIALEGHERILVSDVETQLERPSYTANTLRHLRQAYPDRQFVVILGEDVKENFHLWKDYAWILREFDIVLYPRFNSGESSTINFASYRVQLIDAPRVEVSSTQIRNNIQTGKSIRFMVPDGVIQYIASRHLYR